MTGDEMIRGKTVARRAKVRPAVRRARISDGALDELCACIPEHIKSLSRIEREVIRRRVTGALVDAQRIKADHGTLGVNAKTVVALATLRKNLSNARVSLDKQHGVAALLNFEADRASALGGDGFELVFDPDPARGQFVCGAKLVALTRTTMGMLEGLIAKTEEKMAQTVGVQGKQAKRNGRAGNRHSPANNFLISTAALIFRDVVGDDRRLHGLTFNEVRDRGSPVIEFVRCVLRLAGEDDSAGGDNVKQHLRALREKKRRSGGFPIHL